MSSTVLLILAGVVLVVAGLIVFMMAKQYRKVGPNEVLIISGGRQHTIDENGDRRKVGYRIQVGGGAFLTPFIESAQVLSLETCTINIKTPEVLTKQGVHIIAEASAQVKVASNENSIRRAAEQFLGRGAAGIRDVSIHILEGYVRSAIGSMTVEEIYQGRDAFASKVRNEAVADFARMGIELLSFNLGDISDAQGYITALGMPRIAAVKRDAAVAEAESTRDTSIKSAEAHREGEVVRYQVESDIAKANHDYELKRAGFLRDINERKAQSDAAYELERLKQSSELKKAEYSAKLVEKEAAIGVEKEEIKRRELELEATIKKPAEARKFQIEQEAEAERIKLAEEARGRAEAKLAEGQAAVDIKKAEGASKIEYTRKLGQAEADAMQAKAEAFKNYSEAAIYEMFIEKLPELARAVSEPLSRIDKMIVVDGGEGSGGASRITKQVADILAQLPDVVESLSGIDLKKVLSKKTGKTAGKEPKKDRMDKKDDLDLGSGFKA